jgi:2'-5' RNA ligase
MADQPDYSGSCMIALYPPKTLADALATGSGLDPADIHLTVAYTGDAAGVNPSALNAAAGALAARPPVAAILSGHARFTGGTQDCVAALVTSPELDDLRHDAETLLAEQGIPLPSEFGFTGHMALEYIAPCDPSPVQRIARLPVTFTAVSAVHGKDRTDYEFTGDPLAGAAAEAFLAGWALSGGPGTPGIGERCALAVVAALEHADDPDVLELALDLGKLEGTWAKVYQRRRELIAGHTATIKSIWREAVKHLDTGAMIRVFRKQAYLTREAADGDSHWAEVIRAAAIAAATGMLNGIRNGPEYGNLVTAIEIALAVSAAEGKTAALAVAAEAAGKDGFDWASAYAHMYEPLTHLEDLPGMADPWIEKLIAGNATDIGRRLAVLAAEGASYDDMLDAVEELAAGDDIRAVEVFIDYAMSGSAVQGALDLYSAEGVEEVNWLDAGDARVCPVCEENAANSPYKLAEFPTCPGHVGCRCAPSVHVGSLLKAFTPFLKAAA